MKLQDYKKKLLKDPEFKELYERPRDLLEEGSYFTRVKSEGKGSRSNEYWAMPCKATIIKREGNLIYAVLEDKVSGKA